MAAESIIDSAAGCHCDDETLSLNCNETNRHWLDAVIDPLFAGVRDRHRAVVQPGAVMAAYNKVNAGNDHLLNDERCLGTPRQMSIGANTQLGECARRLDQERRPMQCCGSRKHSPISLRAAYADGNLPKGRLSDATRGRCRRNIDGSRGCCRSLPNRPPGVLPSSAAGVPATWFERAVPLASCESGCPTRVRVDPGINPAEAALAARRADIADRVRDPRLRCAGRCQLIAAVASANAIPLWCLETGKTR